RRAGSRLALAGHARTVRVGPRRQSPPERSRAGRAFIRWRGRVVSPGVRAAWLQLRSRRHARFHQRGHERVSGASMLILYNPPSSARRKPVMPLSLLALGALLEGRHEYTIVDGNLDRHALETIDGLVRDGADMLGITVMPGPQLADSVPLSRELKTRHPNLRIIWGGYFPTQHWDVCLKSGYVDYVVRGHGEVVFQSLIDRLAANEDPTDLAGLAYRQPDG